jgi:hypothetical protein
VATVVEQGVDRLLQHALLVPDDDLRGLQLEQVLQAVVPVDDAAVQIVQVGGGEPSAFERHQRAQVGGMTGSTVRIIHSGGTLVRQEALEAA